MKTIRMLPAVSLVAMTIPAFAIPVPPDDAAVRRLVHDFVKAEQNYDAALLARFIDNSYIEVSPAGEVDEHDRFLSFYTADKKTEWPPMTTSEEQVRLFGTTAIDILKFSYAMSGSDGTIHTREIRGAFIAQKGSAGWKLLGAHYTEIRPVPTK